MTDINQRRSFLQNVTNDTFSENMKDVYTCIPGYVLTFDPDTQRAQIQLGITRTDDVAKTTFDPPPIVDVPVSFPGDDFILEFAVNPGCEGMVHFSQRCIDGWKQTGGIAANPVKRFHHKQDAMFVPGIRSLDNLIASFSNDGIRLRNADASQYVWLKGDNSITMGNSAGTMTLGADGTFTINGARITPDGRVYDVNNVELGGHTHAQGNDGNGDSEQETDPPTQ